jgi:hypothetical protein
VGKLVKITARILRLFRGGQMTTLSDVDIAKEIQAQRLIQMLIPVGSQALATNCGWATHTMT